MLATSPRGSLRPGRIGVLLLTLVAFLTACTGHDGGTAERRRPPAPSGALPAAPAAADRAAAAGQFAAHRGPNPAGAPARQATPGPLRLTGRLAISPLHGPLGTTITASATGLPADTEFTLVWTDVDGAWSLSPDATEYYGREYHYTEQALATARSDGSGAFTAGITVPDGFGFQHDLLVKQGDITVNKAGFDVDMEVTLTPTSGPPGTPITIEARGIGWRQMQNSWTVSYDNQFTGWISAVTTNGRARAVIPAVGAPGVHIVTVLHGDFTFPYLNMQQSPEPDRPQFRLPFTITDGTAALPPPVAQQVLPVAATRVPEGSTALWMDPPEGIVGAPMTLRGAGLPADAAVEITWSSVTGNRVSGAGWEQRVRVIGTATTGADGTLVWSARTPDDLGGSHTIAVRLAGVAGEGGLARAQYLIQPSALPLAAERGPSGTELMLHLKGVGWTETANIYNIVFDNGYMGYACGFNSGGDVQVTIRVSGAPGWHFIDLYPGIYKGKETRPLNFRIPQLTFADDHPGERLPAFHFAFLIEADGTVH